MKRKAVVVALVLALCSISALGFQNKKGGEDDKFRMVQGTVSDPNDNAIEGAVVQLKNTKTLQVRSFITKEHGAYYFHGLDPNIDYSLRAEYQGMQSPAKTLSSFDGRKQPVINLKLEKK